MHTRKGQAPLIHSSFALKGSLCHHYCKHQWSVAISFWLMRVCHQEESRSTGYCWCCLFTFLYQEGCWTQAWLRVSWGWPWAWASSERSCFPKRCHPKLNTLKRQAMVISRGAKTETWISSVNACYVFYSLKYIHKMLTWVVRFSSFEVFIAAVWVDEIKWIADCSSKEGSRNNTCRWRWDDAFPVFLGLFSVFVGQRMCDFLISELTLPRSLSVCGKRVYWIWKESCSLLAGAWNGA